MTLGAVSDEANVAIRARGRASTRARRAGTRAGKCRFGRDRSDGGHGRARVGECGALR